MLKCKSCGGTYEPVLRDGTQYFHACPPLARFELQAAVDAGTIVLPSGETVDEAYERRPYERPNKRDENVMPSSDAKKPATLKAAGAGIVTLP